MKDTKIYDQTLRTYWEAENYVKDRMDTLFTRWDQITRDKTRRNCHKQRKFFSLFVLSVDGILGKDAQEILATLSQIMATKMEEPTLHVKFWFNDQIAVVAASSYYWIIHGARFPSPLRTRDPDWGSGLGLGLAQ